MFVSSNQLLFPPDEMILTQLPPLFMGVATFYDLILVLIDVVLEFITVVVFTEGNSEEFFNDYIHDILSEDIILDKLRVSLTVIDEKVIDGNNPMLLAKINPLIEEKIVFACIKWQFLIQDSAFIDDEREELRSINICHCISP